MGLVAKYYDQQVCVCVCLREYLLNHMQDVYHIFLMLPMAVAQSFSGGVTKYQGEEAIWEISSPLSMYCAA